MENNTPKAKDRNPDPADDQGRTGNILKTIIRYFLIIIFFIILITAAVVASIPSVISSDYFNNKINVYSSGLLKRQVLIETVQCSWSKGILIENIRVEDDPDFSTLPVLSLDRLALSVNLKDLIKGRLSFYLRISGPKAGLIRNREGKTNLENLLNSLKESSIPSEPIAPEESSSSLFPLALPFDINGRVLMEDIIIIVKDKNIDHSARISEGNFIVEIPSLKQQPVSIKMKSEIEMDGKSLSPLSLQVNAEMPADQDGRLDLSDLVIKVQGEFLDNKWDIKGRPFDLAMEGGLEIELDPITDLVRIFMGSGIPRTTGRISIKMESNNEKNDILGFNAELAAMNISLSEGPLGKDHAGPVNIRAGHRGTVNIKAREMDIQKGNIRIQDATGLEWTGKIKAEKNSGLNATVDLGAIVLDLKELTSISEIIPVEASGMVNGKIRGKIEDKIDAEGEAAKKISFVTALKGKDIIVSKGLGLNSILGPVNFDLSHSGEFRPEEQALKIDRGEIRLQNTNHILWRGNIAGFNPRKNTADLNVGPLTLNFRELFTLARNIMPGNIAPVLEGLEGLLEIKNVNIKGPVMKGKGTIALSDLSCRMPSFKAESKEGAIEAGDLEFDMLKGEVCFEKFFPVAMDGSCKIELSDIKLKGKENIEIDSLGISSLKISGKNMAIEEGASFGIKGTFFIKESGFTRGIKGPFQSTLKSLRHSIDIESNFNKDPGFDFDLKGLEISASDFSIKGLGSDPLNGDIDIDLAVRGKEMMLVPGSIFGMTGSVSLIQSIAAGEISVKSKGRISGLQQVSKGYIVLKPDSINVSNWDVNVFSKHARLDLLKDGPLKIKPKIDTSIKDLRIKKALSGKSFGRIDLGNFKVNCMAGDYLFVNLGTSARGLGEKGGDCKGFANISFRNPEDFSKTPLETLFKAKSNIKGKMETEWELARLPGIEVLQKISRAKGASLLKPIIEGIDIQFRNRVYADIESGNSSKIGDPVYLDGQFESEAKLNIEGGKAVAASCSFNSPGMDMALGDMIWIRNLQSNLIFNKKYSVSPSVIKSHINLHIKPENGLKDKPKNGSKAKSSTGPKSFLSNEVLEPKGYMRSESVSQLTVQRLMEDNRGGIEPSLSFDYCGINVGELSVKIRNYLTALRFIKGMPYIDYFQMDLMGGTMLGCLSLKEEGESFRLGGECSFSGINPEKVGPKVIKRDKPEQHLKDTELSGRVSFQIPLSKDMEAVLDGFNIELNLTHIGSRTLERFLYAMDPQENNETIVKQRQLLQMGSPKWISLKIREGSLSLNGVVEVKGMAINLPPVERLNISGLPVQKYLKETASKIEPALDGLEMISADRIRISESGRLEFLEN